MDRAGKTDGNPAQTYRRNRDLRRGEQEAQTVHPLTVSDRPKPDAGLPLNAFYRFRSDTERPEPRSAAILRPAAQILQELSHMAIFTRRRLALLLICAFGGTALSAQVAGSQSGHGGFLSKQTRLGRAVRNVFVDSTLPGEQSLRFYPTLGYAPETSLEIGASALLLFNAKGDTANRQSELNAFGFVTLKGQYGLWIEHAIYGDKDKWFFLGRGRFQRFPLLYYGIGPDPGIEEPALVDATYILLRERVLKRVAKNLFFGPEVDYQQLINTKFRQPEDGPPLDLPPGAEGTRNVGLGLGLVYDNRHNVLNVRKGAFAEFSGLDYRPTWGAERRFYGLTLDARMYKPLDERRVLAAQIFAQSFSGDIPFNQMALMGGETIMRGYYSGRYRDREMLAAQVEHRWLPFRFSKRFGAAAFLGAAAVAPSFGTYDFSKTRVAGGGGLRYLLFPNKDVYLRFDLGVNSDGGVGFYIFTGEAF
jgi:hypothetical protein